MKAPRRLYLVLCDGSSAGVWFSRRAAERAMKLRKGADGLQHRLVTYVHEVAS